MNLMILAICGLAVLAYVNTIPAGFTFDDNFAVVRKQSPRGVAAADTAAATRHAAALSAAEQTGHQAPGLR